MRHWAFDRPSKVAYPAFDTKIRERLLWLPGFPQQTGDSFLDVLAKGWPELHTRQGSATNFENAKQEQTPGTIQAVKEALPSLLLKYKSQWSPLSLERCSCSCRL
jgi:hypothetical protein